MVFNKYKVISFQGTSSFQDSCVFLVPAFPTHKKIKQVHYLRNKPHGARGSKRRRFAIQANEIVKGVQEDFLAMKKIVLSQIDPEFSTKEKEEIFQELMRELNRFAVIDVKRIILSVKNSSRR